MIIYKFRPLGTGEDFCRAKEIIETGKFWCSQFSELNDPVEGGFHTYSLKKANKIFTEKMSYKICSFSSRNSFYESTLWGYYANGFRGIAIEVEVEDNEVKEVMYEDQIKTIEDYIESEAVMKVLTTKLRPWRNENEYRFLIQSSENKHAIGKTTSIYFGNPYGYAINNDNIYRLSKSLEKYKVFKNELVEVAKNKAINCFNVEMRDNGVEMGAKL